jgi:hypothetical protein
MPNIQTVTAIAVGAGLHYRRVGNACHATASASAAENDPCHRAMTDLPAVPLAGVFGLGSITGRRGRSSSTWSGGAENPQTVRPRGSMRRDRPPVSVALNTVPR